MTVKNNGEVRLVRLGIEDKKYMECFYDWMAVEEHLERFTCREVSLRDKGEYIESMIRAIDSKSKLIYALVGLDGSILGRIVLFDYNPRNHSAEFGYYMPTVNRGKGLGSIMVRYFLRDVFSDLRLELNKVYATTALGNNASISLLEGFGFRLDGVMREHYWFRDSVEDQLHYSLLKREHEV